MKNSIVLCFVVLILLVGIVISSIGGAKKNQKVQAAEYLSDVDFSVSNIATVDDLGRTLPTISGYKDDKFVGLFYFTWLGQQGENQTTVYDITKLLRNNKSELFSFDSDIAPMRLNYFFNEPLYGYYNSADPYVIRKHLEMFIAADIDFLALDFTNGIFYSKVLFEMLDIYLEYQSQGWDVPKLMFFTNTSSGTIVSTLYNRVYNKAKYDSLWFRGSGQKPIIIAWEDQMTDAQKEFFSVRSPQWPEAEYTSNGWPYVEKVRPQRLYENLMSVSVAQHTGNAFSFSIKGMNGGTRESWGRGYTTENPENGNIDAILRGDNFQEQWDHAIKIDPEIVFVTGWNEWTALKLTEQWSDVPFWVDTFNTEYSRDIEMTKSTTYVKGADGTYIEEGYGDNYYLQLIANVRKYKGITLTKENYVKPNTATIDINGDIAQWDVVSNSYLNMSTQKVERDYYGYIKSEEYHYTQAAPNNFIKDIKVTNDGKNIYFKITCENDITSRQADELNWMNLLIGVDGSKDPQWENFNYVINRYASGGSTSLEKVSQNGQYVFEKVADISYNVSGNVMQIEIPQELIGINKEKFSIHFKVTDSIEKPEDIMDYYVSGDSVPMGRLAYVYANEYIENDSEDISQNGGANTGTKKISTVELAIIAGLAVIIIACAVIIISKMRPKH